MNTSNWKTININSIFDINYGNKLDRYKMDECVGGIPFVARTAQNNGISTYVMELPTVSPNSAGCLTVALGGSIGKTFLQETPFYTSQNVAVLQPKTKTSKNILLFIATLIEIECSNKFIAYGRELNKHIKVDFTIKLPVCSDGKADWNYIEEIASKEIIPLLPNKTSDIWKKQFSKEPVKKVFIPIKTQSWKTFRYDEIFLIEKGKRLTKADMVVGDINYIGATDSNNGITAKIGNTEHVFNGNKITVSYNGSIAEAYYQAERFWATDDVNVLTLKGHTLNKYIAMFLCTLISIEKYRFNYGRKWDKELMKQSLIKLPVDSHGNPDWQFMEAYIKSLPYSANM